MDVWLIELSSISISTPHSVFLEFYIMSKCSFEHIEIITQFRFIINFQAKLL